MHILTLWDPTFPMVQILQQRDPQLESPIVLYLTVDQVHSTLEFSTFSSESSYPKQNSLDIKVNFEFISH